MKKESLLHAFQNIGLTNKEVNVFFTLLEKGSLNATDIARAVGVPRTSVLLLLDALKKKKFIERVKVGGHYEWEACELTDIETQVTEKLSTFKESIPDLQELVRAQGFGKKFKVSILSGASGMLKGYYKLLELKGGEHIYYFEGTDSVNEKMKMRDQSLIKWQQAFRESGIVIEAIGSSAVFKTVKQKKGIDVLRAYENRLIVTYELPSGITDFPCDIAVLPNTVVLFIPKQELVIFIDSTELALTFKKIFEGLKMISTVVDANKMVKNLLVEK